MKSAKIGLLVLLAAALPALPARSEVVGLPSEGRTTLLTARVREQVRIAVPAGIDFDVADTAVQTRSRAGSVALDNIVTSSGGDQVRVLVRAGSDRFTPPVPGAATWEAGDVSWSAAPWANAAGHAGTLSSGAFTPVATGVAGASALSTSSLVFTLAGKPSVRQSGDHTLVIVWKVESMGAGEP